MGIVHSTYRELSEEGAVSFLSKSKSYIIHTLTKAINEQIPDPVYRLVVPEYIELNIGNNSASFHKSGASLEYDFRDDFDHEKDILSLFMSDLKADDVLYDIGANVGLYASFAGM